MELLNGLALESGWDGRVDLLLGGSTPAGALPKFTQAPLPLNVNPRNDLRWFEKLFHHAHVGKDVTEPTVSAGHALRVIFHEPPQWADCSPATCFVTPELPKPQRRESHHGRSADGGNSDGAAGDGGGTAVTEIPWTVKQYEVEELVRLEAQGLGHRQPAAGDGGMAAGWRGFAVSVPYMPGGGTSVPTPSSAAVEEAASGKWLHELESGQPLPRVCAPGLSSGCFGSWAQQDDRRDSSGSAGGRYGGMTGIARTVQLGGGARAAATAGVVVPPPVQSLATAAAPRTQGMFADAWQLEEDEESDDEGGTRRHEGAGADGTADGTGAGRGQDTAAERAATPPTAAAEASSHAAGSVDAILASNTATSDRGGQASASTSATAAPLVPKAKAKNREWAVRGHFTDLAERYDALRPRLAHRFGFELDTFQKEAVLHLEAGHSVFVAAHTSAGKTVVAEYALALATNHCTRAIYTSPIKTISNQKFRDFSAKFEVGLLTGDVQIKPEAPCLIMTTEILRSMLYRGADIIRDVEWVIFDEVHYVNDAERGVVWEEVIIMLPPHVGMVLLSATVPNVMDFAGWVGRTKRKVMYVMGTTQRPVPLEHSLYYNGELYTVCAREAFLADGHQKAVAAWKRKNAAPETKRDEKAQRPTGRGDPFGGGGRGGAGGGRGAGASPAKHYGGSADNARQQLQGANRGGGPNSGPMGLRTERQQMLELVHMLNKKGMLPLAVFCFSKKRCDSSIDAVSSLDLTTSAEKHGIHVFVEKCLSRLKEVDRQLPQVLRLRDLLRRGLAVHHAGLLPIMKEVVEMLFCQGVIKLLFCTETFAMGVNAPTRTVMFHSLRKHDGKEFRYLLPGEYTQMAGRAGRRGLDPVGNVLIACWDDIPGEGVLKEIMQGKGVQLASQFRLTYGMILNMLRVEDLKVEDMLKRSFAEWHAQKLQPQARLEAQDIEKQMGVLAERSWPECYAGCSRQDVEEYFDLCQRLDTLNGRLQATIMGSKAAQQALVPGRAVLYQNPVNALTELAVVLGPVDDSASPSIFGSSSNRSSSSSSSMGGGAGAGEGLENRKYYVLVLHTPGLIDARHQQQIAAEAAAKSSKPAAAAPLADEFRGMVLKGKGDGGAAKQRGPGSPLPRYETIGNLSALLVEAPSHQLVGVCKTKITVDAKAILTCDGDWGPGGCLKALTAALRDLAQLRDSTGGAEPPTMDPRQDFKINDMASVQGLSERAALISRRAALRPHRCPQLSDQLGAVRTSLLLTARRDALAHQLSDASLQQMPEFNVRVGVLERLGYVDHERAVQLKGRACCEVASTQDELVATEALFAGLFTELTPAEAVALLSTLVFQEKSDVDPQLTPRLADARQQLQQLVVQTAQVQREAGLDVEPQEYVAAVMHCGLMQVVHEWALGTPFAEICELTDVMEGSIVRAVVRLDQACRELMDAARVMGNTALFQQMEAASEAVKRDVIFAASLYIS